MPEVTPRDVAAARTTRSTATPNDRVASMRDLVTHTSSRRPARRLQSRRSQVDAFDLLLFGSCGSSRNVTLCSAGRHLWGCRLVFSDDMENTMTDVQLSPPRVVVGVDGSEQSKHALRWAARLADTFGARVDVISAWRYPVGYGWSTVPPDWNPAQDMEKQLSETVDEILGAQRSQDTRLTVYEGNAAQILIKEGAGALMIVVGSRGHGGFSGLLLGSVSAAVAEHASCPVLVVHGDEVPTAPTT